MRIIVFGMKIFFVASILQVLFFSCDKREEYIPFAYVDFSVDLNINNDLSVPGNSMLYPYEGYSGVVISCENYDYSAPDNSIFHAFDATCTFEVSDSCSLKIDGLYGECPCCGSKYEFLTGSPLSGSAVYPLKSYSIYVYNNILYIKN